MRQAAGAFKRDRRGNVAMMWGLMGTVLLGLMGLTIDFTRAQMIRNTLQNAADGAALAAARAVDLPESERQTAGRAFFDAEAGDLAAASRLTLTPLEAGGYVASVEYDMPVSLARLIFNRDWTIGVESEALQSGLDLEVAMVLDITGSMAGTRITDLRAAAADLVDIVVREEQTPFTSKVALVPYSNSVNPGTYATNARGSITPGRSISAASWRLGSTSQNIAGATRANPVRITSNNHGLSNGDRIWIGGVSGMTQLNNKAYTVRNASTNAFDLWNADNTAQVNGSGYSSYSSGGTIRECQVASCRVVVTASNHGLEDNDYVFITGVGGMTQINSAANTTWRITLLDDDTFSLQNSTGPSYSAYTSGGTAYCTEYGCQYLRFTNASGSLRVHQVSNCVSERTGAQAYTDANPSSAPVGLTYPPPSGNTCPTTTITPLTSDRAMLTSRINALTVTGSTAGQIGAAWGWYLLSPNFGGSMFSGESQPLSYSAPHKVKIVILMTDGEFNTPYCNGVIAANAGSGSGNASDHINCNATNGDPDTQTEAVCDGMKDRGVIVYTVGFGVTDGTETDQMLEGCATSANHAFSAESGEQLRAVFRDIANQISQLRLSR